MLFSHTLIPTLKEAPQDAINASYTFLTRAGFIRKVGAGIYEYLPLGFRVLKKVERIVREEMDKAGALEVMMPALLPADYFKETGRFETFGENLFRFSDRKGSEMHLGPTHEEIVTDIARREIRSWRDMPKNLYQIQTKFRDEPRPRGGLLRCREFIMKDAYSFDVGEDEAKRSYEKMREAYTNIYTRMGLVFRLVAADSGAMGGQTSAEFQVLADAGEDSIVACSACDYAANVEVATVYDVGDEKTDETKAFSLEKVFTPGKESIEDVATFLKCSTKQCLKALLFTANKEMVEVVMVIVRGDHEVNEVAVARALNVSEIKMAEALDILKAGAVPGYAGPIKFGGKVLVDRAASKVLSGVVGANEKNMHLTGVQFGRDFSGEVVDVRLAKTGDGCPRCGETPKRGKLVSYKGIEAGHIFILGTHYSSKMGASFLDEHQKQKPIVMGCYGIGVSRLVAATVEQHHDERGMKWPMSIAPYQVHLCTLGKEEKLMTTAKSLYDGFRRAGVEVLWDDRDERAGVKFMDADLIGIPFRVTLGLKSLADGKVEWKRRSEDKNAELIDIDSAVSVIASQVHLETRTPSF